MSLADFQWLRPWWLLALLALPLLWYLRRAGEGAQRGWARIVDAHLLPHLLAGNERPRRWPLLLLVAGWTIATLALAGPAWERLPTPVYRNQAARVIALQLSASMLAADLKPDRLTRARYAIRDLLDAYGDGQVALLGYAGEAFVVAPMTDDSATVRNLLAELDPSVMPVGGNETGEAIRRGVELVRQAGSAGGELLLVLDAASADAERAARLALDQGVRVSVLAVGTAAGAPVSLPQGGFWKDANGAIVVPRVDAAALRRIAAAGGGRFLAFDTTAPDLSLLARGLADPTQAVDAPGAESAQMRDRGPWLALLLLPFALAAFRRGGLLAVLLVLGFAPLQPAQAMQWRDLWQRPDQQAWQALQAGEAAAAASLAEDPALRGAARFRAGDAAGAAADWAPGQDADAAYNFGNALAAQQQYRQAIAAWDEALRRDPAHADARANKQAVEEWLRQQPPESGQDKGDASKDKQDPSGAKPDQPDAGGQGEDAPQQAQDASARQDGQQQNGESGQQGEAAQSGQPGEPGKADDASRAAGDTQQGRDQAGRAATPKPGDRDESKAEPGQTGEGQPDPRQQQAFREAMEQALREDAAAKPDAPQQEAPRAASGTPADGAPQGRSVVPAETEAEREQREATEQWLQRVPDDPGGLLRRKFQLEHERRQRGEARGER